MARIICIANQKGGVGKTTTAVNLSAALANAGQDVCLIDLDPQAHASLHLGISIEDDEPSVYDLLTSDLEVDEIRHQVSASSTSGDSGLSVIATTVTPASERTCVAART